MLESAIQKFFPSLQTPHGIEVVPVGKKPRGVMSAALKRETLPEELPSSVTSTLWPSKAATNGKSRPLPVNVARTAPVEARTTVTDWLKLLGTQRLAPSKAGNVGCVPTV